MEVMDSCWINWGRIEQRDISEAHSGYFNLWQTIRQSLTRYRQH